MTRRHDGSVVLVTGAGQGIGRGCARALGEDGATVVLLGRTTEKLQHVAEELEIDGIDTMVVTADVGMVDEVHRALDRIRVELGRLDVVVNNAQSFVFRTLDDTTAEDLEVAYRSGTLGTFHVMQAARPLLTERGGAIVNFGTSSALTGEARFASYAMAKEAIRALTASGSVGVGAGRDPGELRVPHRRVPCLRVLGSRSSRESGATRRGPAARPDGRRPPGHRAGRVGPGE